MSGTSNHPALLPHARQLRTALTRPRRALVAVGAASFLAVGALVAVPEAAPGPDAYAAEREVVTEDVDLGLDLVGQRTSLSRLAAPKAPTRVTRVIRSTAASRPVLRPGYKGPAVVYLQKRLKVRATGWYGPMTLRAVVAFQRAHHLPAQGYVGPRTWAALMARPAAKAAAKPVVRTAAPAVRVTAGRVCPAPGAAFGQGFGARRAGHLHQGMDLMGRRGMPLLAIEAGVVIREGRQCNGALRIVLQGRSGSKFYYGHMSKDLVHAGARVARGQVIGLMGDSGSPGAVHLHFEYWRSGGESAAVDPSPLLHALC